MSVVNVKTRKVSDNTHEEARSKHEAKAPVANVRSVALTQLLFKIRRKEVFFSAAPASSNASRNFYVSNTSTDEVQVPITIVHRLAVPFGTHIINAEWSVIIFNPR